MGKPVVATRRDRIVKLALRSLVLALALTLVVSAVVFETFETFSPAMEPTLLAGDRLLVDRSVYGIGRHWSDPAPGDVVVVRCPGWGQDDVKRVIGVPGDRIEIRDDVVYRNGAPIRRGVVRPCRETEGAGEDLAYCETFEETTAGRTWRTSHSRHSAPESMPEQTVPPGTVFLLGDYRDHSNDSRNPRFGMVPVANVRRATVIYWSAHPGRTGQRIE